MPSYAITIGFTVDADDEASAGDAAIEYLGEHSHEYLIDGADITRDE